VRLIGVWSDPRSSYVLAFPEADADLCDFIGRSALGHAQTRSCALQLLKGVRHLVCRGVVHRDLKPANILVYVLRGDDAAHAATQGAINYRIADFGRAKFIGDCCLCSVDDAATQVCDHASNSPTFC